MNPSPRRRLALLLLLCVSAPLAAAPLTLPPPDVSAYLAADAAVSDRPHPWRFAAPIAVAITPQTHGVWTTAADGSRQWRLELVAPGARSLNFGFGRFRLPAGAQLRIAGDHEQRGPWGAQDDARGQLWTPVLQGERATLTLDVPPGAQATLELIQVGYGFRGFGAKAQDGAKSGACNVDVVCPEGEDWADEARSVARFTINGLFLCTGQLLNNTAGDFRPFFLTAAHCASTEVDALTTVFYFNYETSVCGGSPDGSLSQSVAGAQLRAASEVPSLASPDLASDFALLELLESPPASFGVYYAGWDNRDRAPDGVVAIHHPAGDEKRISFEFDPLTITAYGEGPDSPLSSLNPTHLRVDDWDIGTTEGGSSGSGIWTRERHLVGQLSGGGAACGNDLPDWYGRFHQNWFRLPTPRTSVASWLDPIGSGVATLDGADPNAGTASPTKTRDAGPGSSSGAGSAGLLILLAGLAAGWRRRRG